MVPGESNFNSFAVKLLESVKDLKDGRFASFAALMSQAMGDNDVGGPMRKTGSLPNVQLETQPPVIGTAYELPSTHIPQERGCKFVLKQKRNMGRVLSRP